MQERLLEGLEKKLFRDDIEHLKKLSAARVYAAGKLKGGGVLLIFFWLLGGGLWYLTQQRLPALRHAGGFELYQALAVVAAVVGGIIFIRRWMASAATTNALGAYQPSIKIREVKVGSLQIQACQGGQGTYLFNRSGYTRPVELEFYTESNVDKLNRLLQEYNQLIAKLPEVLGARDRALVKIVDDVEHPLFSEESRLYELLQQMVSVLENLESKSEKYHFLHLSAEQLSELLHVNANDAPQFKEVVSHVNDQTDIRADIRRIEGALLSPNTQTTLPLVDSFLDQLQDQVETSLKGVDRTRRASFAEMIKPFADDLERLSTITSYNCYCPECNKDVIESTANSDWSTENGYPRLDIATRMEAVPGGTEWECAVCGRRTSTPFPVHKMLDNLLFPTMDRLLQENRVERLKFYHDAEKHKMDILESEQREIRDSIENAEQTTSLIQGRIRDVAAGVETAKSTIDLLMAEMGSFETLNRNRLESISREISTVVNDISDYRNKALSSYNASVDEMMQNAEVNIEKLAHQARQDDEARMAIMREMSQNMQAVATTNTQIANNTGQMSQQLGQIAQNTQETAKATLESSASTRAMARQSGAYKASFPNVTGMVGQTWGDVKQSVTGASDYDRGRSEIKPESVRLHS